MYLRVKKEPIGQRDTQSFQRYIKVQEVPKGPRGT